MESDMILPLVMRWLHIFSAIIALGGSIFIRFVLLPALAANLDKETLSRVRTAVRARWQKFVHTCILLFLVSGLYNYLFVTRFNHPDQPLYHMLFGIKFLLALAVFAVAIVLTSRRADSEAFRPKAKGLLTVLVALAVLVVLISGFMKNLPVAPLT